MKIYEDECQHHAQLGCHLDRLRWVEQPNDSWEPRKTAHLEDSKQLEIRIVTIESFPSYVVDGDCRDEVDCEVIVKVVACDVPAIEILFSIFINERGTETHEDVDQKQTIDCPVDSKKCFWLQERWGEGELERNLKGIVEYEHADEDVPPFFGL